MNTLHVSAPKTPTTEIIEAMVEAALDNKHNMEAIYRAIVATLEKERTERFVQAKEDLIVCVEVCSAVQSVNGSPNTPVVLLDALIGPQRKRAHGYLPLNVARQLAWDIATRANQAEEMGRHL